VPRVSNAAAVNGDCADAATVVTASETAVDAAVVADGADVADVAEVADVADDAAVSDTGEVDASDDADGDELEHAAPARPSTAIPPMRKKVRRSATGDGERGDNDLVMCAIQHPVVVVPPRSC